MGPGCREACILERFSCEEASCLMVHDAVPLVYRTEIFDVACISPLHSYRAIETLLFPLNCHQLLPSGGFLRIFLAFRVGSV